LLTKLPKTMLSSLISRIILLVFGTLLPAYRSYKAIKNKNVREYVKWMMYWVVYAIFMTCETFADMLLSWVPLYYEIKIIFIIWLLSPATKGSSILYRKFVHPRLLKHEKSIDKYINEAQTNGYAALLHVGRRGLSAAGETIVKTAASSQTHLFQTLRRYNSMQDLLTSDGVDGRQRQQAWYDGMPPPPPPQRKTNFDPDEDVDVLQKQYRSSSQRVYVGENPSSDGVYLPSESQYYGQRRDSDPGFNMEDSEGYTARNNGGHRTLSQSYDDAVPSEEIFDPNNVPYESQTLPRMRKGKARKPIANVFPDARVTRSGRKSGGGGVYVDN